MAEQNRQWSQIVVEVDGHQFEIDPNEYLKIDYFQIKEELLRYASNVAWIGSIKEAVSKQLGDLEFEVDKLYASLDLKYRDSLEGKKAREMDREVKSNIYGNATYQEYRRRLSEMRYLEGKIKAILSALSKKDSMLVQLCTLYKNEQSRL